VAGVIGAATNNQIGISSLSWQSTLIIQKILDANGDGDTALMIEAVDEAISFGAKVINLSVGNAATDNVPCSSLPAVQAMITYANNMGVVVVAAAGNDSADASTVTPASCQGVITTGAYTQSGNRADFSNFGPVVDLAAPGQNVYTLVPPNTYGAGFGTSFAAPHVTSVVSLMISVNPNLTPSQITQILKNTATPAAFDQPIGNKLNALAAVQAAQNAVTPNPWDSDGDGDLDFLDFLTNLYYQDILPIFQYNSFISFYGQH
jgi:subtilisin family serine protease